MSLKIHKHFDYQTPFTEATTDEELAKIMRLKYPKACSNLETGAEFFADMVEGVRKHEAWKVIGFDSFEDFCRNKLGKTLAEVEEIVEGVKLLGGNPTEEQAKAASKMQRQMKEENPAMSYSEIGNATGTSRQAAHKACQPKKRNAKRLTPAIVVRMTRDPSRTALNIREKMGVEYASKLAIELTQ